MTDHLKQSISALLDEEASEIEVHRLLREFDSDDELKVSWVRYQQIRSVSQGQHVLSESQHLDLHARISSEVEAEETHSWQGPSVANWQKPVAGFAVAASLVVAVLVGVNFNQQLSPSSQGDQFASNPVSQSAITKNNVVNAQLVSTNGQNSFAEPTSSPARTPQSAVAFNEIDLELKELDEDKQQRLREYLMRHDRMSQMSNQTRTVNFQTPKRSNTN